MHCYTLVNSTSWLDKIIYPELFKVPPKFVALCIYLPMCYSQTYRSGQCGFESRKTNQAIAQS